MIKGRRLHWAWIVLAVCFFNIFINYSIRLGYSLVLPEMIGDLGISRTDSGTIYNAYLIIYVTLAPLAGILTDRIGARKVIAACSLILACGSGLMGAADNLLGACIFFGLAGLGSTGMWTPIVTVVQRWFSIRRRGMALGILSVGFGLGYANMGLVFPWIVNNFSWRYSWYFLGAGALIMVAANGLLLRSDPESSGYRPWGEENPLEVTPMENPEPGSFLTSAWAFRQSAFWFIALSYLFIAYAVYGFGTFLIDFARHQLGWSLEHSSFLATISGIGQVAGVLIILPLSDYIGRKKTLLLAHFVITCILAAVLAAGDSRLAIYALAGLMSFFMGAVFPLYGASAGDYFPKHMIGTIMGIWTPFYGLGAVMVHWITGLLRDTQGNYIQAFILCAVSAFMAFLLMLPVKKPKY